MTIRRRSTACSREPRRTSASRLPRRRPSPPRCRAPPDGRHRVRAPTRVERYGRARIERQRPNRIGRHDTPGSSGIAGPGSSAGDSTPGSSGDAATPALGVAGRRLWADLREAVGKAVVGGDETVRLVAIALLADGHVLVEDVPGTGKTLLARAIARALGARHRPPPGHARPPARPTSPASSLFEPGGLRFVPGPRVHQRAAGRRDQPGHAADAVGAARGDAGAPGLGRGDDPAPARPVRRARDPEPRRVRGDVRAARRPSSTASWSAPASATRTRRASGRSRAGTRTRPSRSTPLSPSSTATASSPFAIASGRCGSPTRSRPTSSRSCGRRVAPRHRARREPTGHGRAVPRVAGGRGPRGPRLRLAGRREAGRDARPRAPPDVNLDRTLHGATIDTVLASILGAVAAPPVKAD